MRTAVALLRPTARAVPLRSIAGVAALAAAPAVITVARGGTDLAYAWVAAAVVGGAGLAYAVDDDAEVLVAPSPVPLWLRRALRLLIAAAVVTAGWSVATVAGAGAGLLEGRPTSDLAVEAFTAAGVAIAVAGAAHRRLGVDQAGLGGAATGVLSLLVVTALASRYAWLPRLGAAEQHDRWLWVAALGWAVTAWTSRDPAERARLSPPRCH